MEGSTLSRRRRRHRQSSSIYLVLGHVIDIVSNSAKKYLPIIARTIKLLSVADNNLNIA